MSATIQINNLTIPQSYMETMQDGMIPVLTQQSANIAATMSPLANCTGEYTRILTRGSLEATRRTQRFEDKVAEEIKTGERIVRPNLFTKTTALSSDDLILKGELPVNMQVLQEVLREAAAPWPDRVALGVDIAKDADGDTVLDGNCIIPAHTSASPYLTKTGDFANGFGGILGVNFVGQHGLSTETLTQQPFINGDHATKYADYASDLAGLDPKKTNVIPVNYTRTGTPEDSGLTIEKIEAITKFLRYRFVNVTNYQFFMAITPEQASDLFNDEKLQKSNYGSFMTIENGAPKSLLGINFVITPDVPIVNIGTAAAAKWVRVCPVWRKESVGFGTWEDMSMEIVKNPLKIDQWLVTVNFGYGAARKRPEDIICVHCDEVGLHAFNGIADPTVPST